MVFYIWDHVICRYSFPSFFPIRMSFISFPCLISLARISSTMLTRSGKSRHLCLLPDLREKVFCLSPLNMILAMGSSKMRYIRLRKLSSTPTFLNGIFIVVVALLWKGVGFCIMIFLHLLKWSYGCFSFILLIWCMTLINFHMLNRSWGQSPLIMVYKTFYMLLDLDC